MSSLAATQADGYYVPAEYVDANKGEKFRRQANGKGHNAYLQRSVVRFELPYKGICNACKHSIGRGTRYNARKNKTNDSYFTTPIYEFVMKCRHDGCSQTFVIRTNPKERGFDYCSGIKIQSGQELQLHGAAAIDGATGQAAVAADTHQYSHDYTSSNMQIHDMANGDVVVASSSLDRLERQVTGQRKLLSVKEHLDRLEKWNQETTLCDAERNAQIRKQFRVDRKAKKQRLKNASAKGWKSGMELEAESTVNDVLQSKQTVFGTSSKTKQKQKWAKVRSASIFAAPVPSSSSRHHRKRQRPDGVKSTSTISRTSVRYSSGNVCPSETTGSSRSTRFIDSQNAGQSSGMEETMPDLVVSVAQIPTAVDATGSMDMITATTRERRQKVQAPTGVKQGELASRTMSTQASVKHHENANLFESGRNTVMADLLEGYGSDSDADGDIQT